MSLGEEKRLSGTAALVMFATLLSRITGFLRNVLIRNIMAPKGYSDEFIVAFSLPDLAFELLVGGAIAAAIIPILSSSLSKNNEKDGWKAIGTFINVAVIAVAVVEVIFFIWTPEFVKLTAKGYEPGTEAFDLVVKLTRILLPQAFFMIMVGQFNGILNAYNKFAAVSFGPVIYNICVAFSILLFGGKSVELTAWGVMVSTMLYFIMQLFYVRGYLKNYQPRLYIKHETFQKLIQLAVPSLIASAIVEINIIIGGSFSTEFAKNSVTMMASANRTWQLPLGVFAQSMGVAMLPTLSSHFAGEKNEEYKRILYKGIRTVMLLCIPSTMILIVLNRQIMQILFKWDVLSDSDSILQGLALMAYAPALLFQSINVILNRAFYSIQNTRIPLLVGTCTIGLNIAANIFFANATSLGAIGTALAYVITVLVNAFLLLIFFSRKTGLAIIPDNFAFITKITAASFIAGIVLLASTRLIPFPYQESFSMGQKVMEILVSGIQLILAGVSFVVASVFLKIDEVGHFLGSGISRIRKLARR